MALHLSLAPEHPDLARDRARLWQGIVTVWLTATGLLPAGLLLAGAPRAALVVLLGAWLAALGAWWRTCVELDAAMPADGGEAWREEAAAERPMTDEPWLEDAVAGRPAAAEGLANPAQVNFRPLAEQGDPTRRNPNVNQVIMMLRDREASK